MDTMNDRIGGIIVGGVFVLMLVMTTSIGKVTIPEKVLIKHNLAYYNQTTGDFICEVCNEK